MNGNEGKNSSLLDFHSIKNYLLSEDFDQNRQKIAHPTRRLKATMDVSLRLKAIFPMANIKYELF